MSTDGLPKSLLPLALAMEQLDGFDPPQFDPNDYDEDVLIARDAERMRRDDTITKLTESWAILKEQYQLSVRLDDHRTQDTVSAALMAAIVAVEERLKDLLFMREFGG